MDHGKMGIIDSIGTNILMTKVWKMRDVKRHIENPDNHHGITGGSDKTGMS